MRKRAVAGGQRNSNNAFRPTINRFGALAVFAVWCCKARKFHIAPNRAAHTHNVTPVWLTRTAVGAQKIIPKATVCARKDHSKAHLNFRPLQHVILFMQIKKI